MSMGSQAGSSPSPINLPFPMGPRARQELSQGLQIVGIARACRGALNEFLFGGDEWGRRELEEWLAGPYALVTSVTRRGVTWFRPSEASELRMATAQLTRVIRSARGSVRSTLETWTERHDSSFAIRAIRERIVMTALDGTGHEGWIPVDLPRMRLLERLESLLVADFLTCPHDYRARRKMCPACHAVTWAPCACDGRHHDLRLIAPE